MQYQMSGASAPQLIPPSGVKATGPTVVPPAPKSPKSQFGLWIALLLVLGGGAAWWASQRNAAQPGGPSGPAASAAIATAVVTQGPVERTLRLTGTTKAEKYASLLSPQLRGSRNAASGGRDGNFRGGMGASAATMGGGNAGGGAGGGGGNSGGGGGNSSASSSTAAPSVSVSSTSGNASTAGSGVRNATSRVGAAASSSRATTPSSGNVSSSSSTTGSSSTTTPATGGGGTPGGGGGGGGGGPQGGGEFGLTLQAAAGPGTRVKKGQVVAEFDRQNMLLRLDDFKASVAQMEASYAKQKAEMEVEKKSHEQSIQLAKAALDKAILDAKTIPVQGKIMGEKLKLAVEEAEANYKQILSEVRFFDIGQQARTKVADIELQQAQAEFKRAELNADKMLIKAPIDGIPVMQTTVRGTEIAQIQAGDQLGSGMMFMQIVDLSSMIIQATINQVDVDQLKIGAKATVKFDAYPELSLPAHVYSIGAMTLPGNQRANFVKSVPVVLKLDQLDARVIPDLTVSAEIQLEKEQQASIAPLNSIFQDSGSNDTYVYVKAGDIWEKRAVELGVANNLVVAIRSGVRAGEVVATERPPLDPGNNNA